MSRRRWLVAFDGKDFYMRRILCITHDGESGEVRYDCKPMRLNTEMAKKFRKMVYAALRPTRSPA